ncbi:hypothetical protein AIIKEEIJ_00195 [Rhodococcus sp. YH1]|nr:hypothetical protein [Rhodococcus sp. YH1]
MTPGELGAPVPERGGDRHLEVGGGGGARAGAAAVGRQLEVLGRPGQGGTPEPLDVGIAPQALGDGGGRVVDAGDRRVRVGPQELGEQFDEAAVVCAQLVRLVLVGVAAEVEERPRGGAALVDVDQQVVDRTRGHDVELAADRAEGDLLPEEHHVDHRSAVAVGPAGGAGLAAEVLEAEPLVAQRTGQFQLGPLHQVGAGVVVLETDVQRCGVDEHAAGAFRRRGGAREHRQIEHHVGAAGQPGEIARGRRDHRRGGRGSARGIGVGQPGDQVVGQGDTLEGAARGGRHRPPRQGRSVLESGDPPDPVVPVARVPVRTAVVEIRLVEVAQVGGGGWLGDAVLVGRRVQRGDPVDHRHGTEAVEGDVVDPAVPQVPSLTDPQDRHVHQRVVGQIDRGGVVGVHPLLRRGHRIGRIGEVQQRDVAEVEVGIDVLVRLTVDLDDPQVRRLELASGLVRGLAQQIQIEVPGQVDVLGDADGHLGCQLLCEPDRALGRGQREGPGRNVQPLLQRTPLHESDSSDVLAPPGTVQENPSVGSTWL